MKSLKGKQHSVEEFAEYWGWTDLHSLARITLMLEPLHRRLICLVFPSFTVGPIVRGALTLGVDEDTGRGKSAG